MSGVGELAGQVAIVTGASGKMGQAIAQAFVAAGCRVLATDKEARGLPQISSSLSCLEHDVGKDDHWRNAVNEAMSLYGRIDILVNNAAYFRPAAFIDTSAADMDDHYFVNQRGVFMGMQTVLPIMQAARRGSIINICSVAAMSGTTGALAYMATKWAVRGLSRAAARELAPAGIRVNAIMPGLIDTAMMDRNPPERNAAIIAGIPIGTAGQAADVAQAALFLAGDRSAYVTGAEIVVDGGLAA